MSRIGYKEIDLPENVEVKPVTWLRLRVLRVRFPVKFHH